MSKQDVAPGVRFGLLTVVGPVDRAMQSYRWLCLCDCGKETTPLGGSLRAGTTKSCGCLLKRVGARSKTHGLTNTSTYHIWDSMIARCTKPSRKDYSRYGGAGITVCDRWRKFDNFLADMGERPDGKSIDRIDNTRGYEPGNCRWATTIEQARNQRSNRIIEFNGERKCSSAWAEHLSMPYPTFEARLRRGWTIEKAILTPVDKRFSRA